MATSNYNLTVEEREQYLYACVDADAIGFDEVIHFTNEIIRRLKESGHSRLLFSAKTPVLLSDDCYEITSYILRNAVSRNIKVAVVDDTPSRATRKQQITGASRKSGLDLKSFREIQAAEEWLLERSEDHNTASVS